MRGDNFSQNLTLGLLPEEMGTARIAPRKKRIAKNDPQPNKVSAMQVIVGLCRCSLEVEDHATYFRLKMALVRTLRRSFRRAIIEVDDLEEPTSERAFQVTLEPANAVLQGKAEATVARVIRWRRWCVPVSDADVGAEE